MFIHTVSRSGENMHVVHNGCYAFEYCLTMIKNPFNKDILIYKKNKNGDVNNAWKFV